MCNPLDPVRYGWIFHQDGRVGYNNRLMKNIITLAAIALVSGACTKQEESASADTATKAYPLDICLVSGEKLGSMGDPVVITHEGQEIKFCCDACIPEFQQDPDKFLQKMEHQNGND